MASCRSRKTGNSSDWSKNNRLPQTVSETSPRDFPIPGLPALRTGGGRSPYPGKGGAPQRQTGFLRTVDAVGWRGWRGSQFAN